MESEPIYPLQQLRQFVELGIAQPVTERRDASITVCRDMRTGITGRLLAHGAEFKDPERNLPPPEARTMIEDRAGRVAFDEQGQQAEERADH